MVKHDILKREHEKLRKEYNEHIYDDGNNSGESTSKDEYKGIDDDLEDILEDESEDDYKDIDPKPSICKKVMVAICKR